MAYIPTKGVFVNGRIADAEELADEFNEVAKGITEVADAVNTEAATALQTAKQYTDAQLTANNQRDVDGGTF